MKQNANIFIIIGLAVLVFGQSQAAEKIIFKPNDFSIDGARHNEQHFTQQKGKIIEIIRKFDGNQGGWDSNDKEVLIEFFNNLFDYVEALNKISENNKKDKKASFSKDYFSTKANILLIVGTLMEWMDKELNKKAINMVFVQKLRGSEATQPFFSHLEQRFSGLKTDLYNIYEVKDKEAGQISVLYYSGKPPGWWSLFKTGFRYSDSIKDLLKDFPPDAHAIEKERQEKDVTRIAGPRLGTEAFWGENPFWGKQGISLKKALAVQTALMVATVMIENAVRSGKIMEIGEIRSMLKEELEEAIRTGKSIMEAAKSAVRTIIRTVRKETELDKEIRTRGEYNKKIKALGKTLSKKARYPFLGPEETKEMQWRLIQKKVKEKEEAAMIFDMARQESMEAHLMKKYDLQR